MSSYRAADTRMAVVVMIVVTLCCFNVIDTATVVRTKILDQHLQDIVLHGPRNSRVLRAAEDSDGSSRYCYSVPCAWEVYERDSRITQYTLTNNCICPNDSTYKCVRSSDVLSSGAYVYHCRQNTTVDDIEYSKIAKEVN
jgi:hypothetical protein